MITRRHLLAGSAATLVAPIAVSTATAQTQAARLTILFDAFGRPSDLKRGWGYSSFIEYGGRRILFDTGSNGANFEHNVKLLGIDLKNLDFVVISHRHNDHTAGLHHVLRENPSLTIYTPVEGAGFNGQTGPVLMNLIKRYVASVPDDMRYFGGNPPTENRPESPWPGARFKTPKGGVLVVGCSHPGIERLVEAATKIDSQLYEVFGGFHLVDIPDDKVTEMVMAFRDKWKIERMAAGHCTGQFAFAELIRVFGPRFDPAGVGSVISLPS